MCYVLTIYAHIFILLQAHNCSLQSNLQIFLKSTELFSFMSCFSLATMTPFYLNKNLNIYIAYYYFENTIKISLVGLQRKVINNEIIMKRVDEIYRRYSHYELIKNTMLGMDDVMMHSLKTIKQTIRD